MKFSYFSCMLLRNFCLVLVSMSVFMSDTNKTTAAKLKLAFFTIVWPCILTNSLWIKPTDALNSKFIGIMTLHVSGSLSAHHQEFFAVHRLWYILCNCDDRLLPGVGWNCSSILVLLESCLQTCMAYTFAECTVNKLLMMGIRTVRNM